MNEVQNTLQVFAKSVIKQARTNLTQKKKNASGKLYKSLDYTLQFDKDGNAKLVFLMEDYGMFQDQGVRGVDPSRVPNGIQKAPKSPFRFGTKTGKGGMRRALDKWIIQRGIAPRDKKGRFMSRASLKFLIARSIYSQGIEPTYFFTKPYQNLLRKLTPDLAEAYGQVTAQELLKEIQKFKNG